MAVIKFQGVAQLTKDRGLHPEVEDLKLHYHIPVTRDLHCSSWARVDYSNLRVGISSVDKKKKKSQ